MGSAQTTMGVQGIHKDREILWITAHIQLTEKWYSGPKKPAVQKFQISGYSVGYSPLVFLIILSASSTRSSHSACLLAIRLPMA